MPLSTDAMLAALGEHVGGRVRLAREADAVAGVRPLVVAEPADDAGVAAALAFADREGLKVLVRGGGTQIDLGAPPSGGDIVLTTAALDGIVEHAPHDQTVTVRAGTPLAALQAHLGEARQWLALDPVLAPGATIGGIIATNATGARRLRYGGVRDQLLGVRVALADGTIARGGGRVVKNVAGYDLPKLFTGALGTLGVILEATFRLYPLPAASRTVVLQASVPAPLCDLVVRTIAAPLVPSALDVVGPTAPDGPCRLAARFEAGVDETAADQARRLIELAGALGAGARALAGDDEDQFWRTLATAPLSSQGEGLGGPPLGAWVRTLSLKASLLPAEVAPWLDDLAEVAAETGLDVHWRAHAGHGIIYARLAGEVSTLATTVAPLRAAALARRGSLVVMGGPPDILRVVDVWGPVAAVGVMRRLKDQFDPRAMLNPGRFVGGI